MTDIPLLIHQSRSRIRPSEAVVWRLPHSPHFIFLVATLGGPGVSRGWAGTWPGWGGSAWVPGAVLAVSVHEEGLAPTATLAQKILISFLLSKMLLGARYEKPTSIVWKHWSISKMFYRNLLTFYPVQSDWATHMKHLSEIQSNAIVNYWDVFITIHLVA